MDKIGTKYENGKVIHQYIDTDIAKNAFKRSRRQYFKESKECELN